MRKCKKCNCVKEDYDFYGKRTTCKQCMIASRAKWAVENRDKTRKHNQKAYRKKLGLEEHSICECCKKPKLRSEFKLRATVCRECQAEYKETMVKQAAVALIKPKVVVKVPKTPIRTMVQPKMKKVEFIDQTKGMVATKKKEKSENGINFGRSTRYVNKDFDKKHLPEIKRKIAERYGNVV
jgi:hypothetical protein